MPSEWCCDVTHTAYWTLDKRIVSSNPSLCMDVCVCFLCVCVHSLKVENLQVDDVMPQTISRNDLQPQIFGADAIFKASAVVSLRPSLFCGVT
jgi:hypothetical protein